MQSIWLRDCVNEGEVQLKYVDTAEQLADPLTKALPGPMVARADKFFSGNAIERAAHERREINQTGEVHSVMESEVKIDGCSSEDRLDLVELSEHSESGVRMILKMIRELKFKFKFLAQEHGDRCMAYS